ncbi:MAG TPA: hypothetical protein VKG23_03885 [Thermoanaerobaculia bacterium]|nr:hypothetical protein [Thermoanaerobaculia bacterium]
MSSARKPASAEKSRCGRRSAEAIVIWASAAWASARAAPMSGAAFHDASSITLGSAGGGSGARVSGAAGSRPMSSFKPRRASSARCSASATVACSSSTRTLVLRRSAATPWPAACRLRSELM